MEQQLEEIIHIIENAVQINEQIKNMSKEEKQKAISEYYKDYYEKLFSKYTLKEIKEITKQSKKELMKIHEDYKIKSPMYVNRTYSGGLVPINSQLGKYDTPKKRGKYNDYFDWNANKEDQILQIRINELSSELGAQLAICSQNCDILLKTQQELKTYKLLLEAYKDAEKKNDWLCYIEEERHGIRPEKEDGFDKKLLNDFMVIQYVAQKHGLYKAQEISRILGNMIDEQQNDGE